MNNLSGREESIKTLHLKQSSESGHSNDNSRNYQRLISHRNRQHNHHQDYNDFDDPNDSEHFSNHR